jgi:hypothetical protein
MTVWDNDRLSGREKGGEERKEERGRVRLAKAMMWRICARRSHPARCHLEQGRTTGADTVSNGIVVQMGGFVWTTDSVELEIDSDPWISS